MGKFKNTATKITDIVFLLLVLAGTFGFWICFIYTRGLHPGFELSPKSLVMNAFVWAVVPLISFVMLFELYVKVKTLLKVEKYGLIRRSLYSQKRRYVGRSG